MTGYSEAASAAAEADLPVLTKPYRIDELADAFVNARAAAGAAA